MPSGRYINVQVCCINDECIMTVDVYALAEDRAISQGLCGNYDGIGPNDLTQGGLPSPADPEEPIEFIKRFL